MTMTNGSHPHGKDEKKVRPSSIKGGTKKTAAPKGTTRWVITALKGKKTPSV
jgi:hypothetical protein